jgi:hypothetical protein
MAAKRKRAPGGGRKPKGEFGGLESPLSVRMSAAMRAQLAAAARRSKRSLSQELLARLNSSFNQDRSKAVDPAMRALCFLFSSLAYAVHWNMPNWRSDKFLFRAIKVGINKLLDALEPSGEMRPPDFWRVFADMPIGEGMLEGNEVLIKMRDAVRDSITLAIQSPEAMADYAVRVILENYTSPRPQNWEALKEIRDSLLKHQEHFYYGMQDAKRDLRIKGEKS